MRDEELLAVATEQLPNTVPETERRDEINNRVRFFEGLEGIDRCLWRE